jgi:hypothetical protein
VQQATPGGSLIDGSGTVTTGGTSQVVFTANVGRQYLLIQNVSDADLWVNFGTAAVESQPSIKILPDGAVEFSSAGTGVVPTGTVNVRGATTGKAFTAKQA